MERQCWVNAKHSRRETLEVVEIPTTLKHDKLEEAFCKIVANDGVNIGEMDLEACNRIGSKGRVTGRFSHKKD